jgi:membrane protease YdiL (CAAX protease family)
VASDTGVTRAPAGGALDSLLLPGVGGTGDGRRRARAVTGRGIGAILLWGTLQGGFLFLPPLVAVGFNVVLVVAAAWWFVGRTLAGVRREREQRRARAQAGVEGTAAGAVLGDASVWRRRAATFRLRPMRRPLPWLPVAALALVVASAAGLVVLARLLPVPLNDTGPLAEYLRRPYGALPVFVIATGLAPLLEELLFRGWMQRTLERRLAPGLAIGLTAVTFALVHFEAFGFPLRVAVGLAAGYAAWGTRSLWPAVTLHATYNGALLLGSALVPGLDERRLGVVARDPAVLGPAVALLVVGGATCAWALRALARDARAARGLEGAPGRAGPSASGVRAA